MSRNKKGSRLPPWLYEDNPVSSFGLVTSDLLKSKQFQGLSNPAKHLLIVLIVHARTREGQQCCFNALKEYFMGLGAKEDGARFDASNLVHTEGKAFVFPAKHYKGYGFEKRTVCKYMSELKEKGFVEVKLCGKNQYKPNIYLFSEKWKKKTKPVAQIVDPNGVESTNGRPQESGVHQ